MMASMLDAAGLDGRERVCRTHWSQSTYCQHKVIRLKEEKKKESSGLTKESLKLSSQGGHLGLAIRGLSTDLYRQISKVEVVGTEVRDKRTTKQRGILVLT